MIWFYVSIFLISALAIAWSGSMLVKSLVRIARYLGWREFVVAFFIVAIVGSAPNLIIGINSALHKIPQLSFGDIVGGNMVDLTIAVALAVLIGGTTLPAESRMVQTSAIFTSLIAVLPLFLILDGNLSRIDGFILIFTFLVYSFWLFSKSDRFKKDYNEKKEEKKESFFAKVKGFFKNLFLSLFSIIILLAGSQGVVASAKVFAEVMDVGLPVVGMLIVGIGNALPETYFAIISARKKQTWMILGDLMGSVIACATLVLGIVAIIFPIQIYDFSSFALARIFLVISAIFFLIVVRTGKKIEQKEGFLLLLIYLAFLFSELFLF